MTRQMHLGMIMSGSGSHVAGWRMSGAEHGAENLGLIARIVQRLEAAKFDFAFFADAVDTTKNNHPGMIVRLEPLTLLAALSVQTSHIGLVATVSTTYSLPFVTARQFASVDHMSGGRTGWNIVTSVGDNAAKNFGADQHPDTDTRYQMATEYIQLAKGLWDSWEDGARVADPVSGVYMDTSKMHEVSHCGTYYKVKGPLNITRSPQAYPVFFQAGASDQGILFAARTAEVIFVAQQTIEDTLAFRARLNAALDQVGRPRDSIRILVGVAPLVAESRAAALQLMGRLGDMLTDKSQAMRLLSERMGYDMSVYPWDEVLPVLPLSPNGAQGHARQLSALAQRMQLTLRQLVDFTAFSSGHRPLPGTATEIADDLEAWFRSGAVDGFAVLSPWLPQPGFDFCDQVVPELVRRGLFRSEYSATTLRGHLHLDRPAHPLAQAGQKGLV